MKAYKVLEHDYDECDSYGLVIADNAREAKKLAWNEHPDVYDSFDNEFTKLRVQWIKSAKIGGMIKGWYDYDIDLLRKGVFGKGAAMVYCDDDICDLCNQFGNHILREQNGKVVCGNCED